MSDAQPEFSKVIELGESGKPARTFKLSTNDEERKKVAARVGALSISTLEGEISISTTKTEIFVKGVVDAQLVRECVSSLEPLDETVHDEFEVEFTRIPEEASDDPEVEEDWRLPEVHLDPDMDIGELLVQQLSLAMDPFPRKEGAKSLIDLYAQEEKISPFAVLQDAVKKSDDNQ
ncbi:YceD family protein [Hyphococcus sp. DH-69]|uniref:YceD family protein n=1 Tax=Hyphococcus formosus TaxID=3143534 RepID=UPI00398A6EDC